MQISVIIPTYNRKQLLQHTLDSLASDLHPGVTMEVLVIDDGSTDGTMEFVRKNYPTVIVAPCKSKGAPAARNTGLAMATGNFVVYLDSDDVVGPGFFLKKIEKLESTDAPDVVYGAFEDFKSEGPFRNEDIVFKHKYPQYPDYSHTMAHLANFLKGWYMPPHALVWNREFLHRIGGHDETAGINQDVELFIRAMLKGAKIIFVDDGAFCYYRLHSVDARVGVAGKSEARYAEILRIRKLMYQEMKAAGINDVACYKALSTYLFGIWRTIRRDFPMLAHDYLEFIRQVYWPVYPDGGAAFKLMTKVLGPVGGVKLKDVLSKGR